MCNINKVTQQSGPVDKSIDLVDNIVDKVVSLGTMLSFYKNHNN